MIKKLWRKIVPNPFDKLLKQAVKKGKKSFLICWNRGLGDIPLGLYALVARIRTYIPDSRVTFLTRPALAEGFSFLEDVSVIAIPHLKRGEPIDVKQALGPAADSYDVILENPDPTYWVRWQLGQLVPRLKWKEEWDGLWKKFDELHGSHVYIGVHVQTETHYSYEKNWPHDKWEQAFRHLLARRSAKIVLFGNEPLLKFDIEGIIDLRGQTSVKEFLSVIKNRCTTLIAPDSGVLSLMYYIDANFPLKVISLWADDKQGILKQNVPSPNLQLEHFPLIGPGGKIDLIDVEQVMGVI